MEVFYSSHTLVMINLSTAIGLTPGGSGTVHIYTQTEYIEQHKYKYKYIEHK